MSKSQIEEPQTEAVEDDWPYPEFSKAEVDAWKSQYGEISLLEDENDNRFVMRGLGRAEFSNLEKGQYRNEQDYENKLVEQSLLFPQLSEMQLRQKDAGEIKFLFDNIAPISCVGSNNEIEPVAFNPEEHGPKLPGTDAADWKAWLAAARGRKGFFVELEGKGFVFKNLNRSQYETYRTKINTDNASQDIAENTVCSEGVVYPMPDDFKPESNQFLYGTIQSLALMIMKESGFGKTMRVTKL